MIAKGSSVRGCAAILEYGNDKKKGAEEVFRNSVLGETPWQIHQEFQIFQEQNKRCAKNTFSFILSPDIEDSKKFEKKDWEQICKVFLTKMGLSEHQSIAYLHKDKKHKHIHLYVNRIGFDGKAYKDSFIGMKASNVAKEVAKELGLKTVEKTNTSTELTPGKEKIKKVHESVLRTNPQLNLQGYISEMQTYGIHVKPFINKQDELQGFRFEFKGESFKASDIHRSLAASNLFISILSEKERARMLEKEKLKLDDIDYRVKKSLLKSTLQKAISKPKIQKRLKRF